MASYMKISGNQNISRGYKERTVAWNGLKVWQIWIYLPLVCINALTMHVVLKKTIGFLNKFTSTFLKGLS